MNAFESFLLKFAIAAAETAPAVAPLFIHSSQGIAIFNVSEALAAALAAEFASKTAAK